MVGIPGVGKTTLGLQFLLEGLARGNRGVFITFLETNEELEAVAAAKGVTPAQVALAWVLHQGRDIVPIPGTKRRRYLEENAAATDIELSEAELGELASAGTAVGDRYPDMSRING